jgi:hypothetical protein
LVIIEPDHSQFVHRCTLHWVLSLEVHCCLCGDAGEPPKASESVWGWSSNFADGRHGGASPAEQGARDDALAPGRSIRGSRGSTGSGDKESKEDSGSTADDRSRNLLDQQQAGEVQWGLVWCPSNDAWKAYCSTTAFESKERLRAVKGLRENVIVRTPEISLPGPEALYGVGASIEFSAHFIFLISRGSRMRDDTLFYSPYLFKLWARVGVRAQDIVRGSSISASLVSLALVLD